MVLTVLVGIIGGVWLAVSAVLARRALMRAQASTVQMRAELERSEVVLARTRLAGIQDDTRAAKRLTSTFVWRVAGALPVIGATPGTVRDLAREADELSTSVLPHFVEVAAITNEGGLRNGDTINIQTLTNMHTELAAAADALDGVVRRSRALPNGWQLKAVADARAQLVGESRTMSRTTNRLRDVTAIAPAMLGANGKRRYFVALQTNAELRGSGGLLGAYAILEAEHGKVSLRELGPNKNLRDTYPQTTPGLDADFADMYSGFGADGFWLNANMSAHFPTVSKLWSSMYERTTRVHIDGSIAIDPVALAEILKATGPATGPGGELISADNMVRVTESEIYERFPAYAQDDVRNELQLQIARALYARLIEPVSHDVGLLPQLGAAATGGHVRMASNHPDEQAYLEDSPVGGALPATDGPYLQLALNNAGGTKLDYYLQPSIDYSFETARGDSQDVSVTVRLRSDAPAEGLPEYVVIRPDLPGNKSLVPGQNKLFVSVYAGRGATLRGASLDGRPLELNAGTEKGHPVWSTFVTIDPGQERALVLALTERGTDQTVTVVPPATVKTPAVKVRGGVLR